MQKNINRISLMMIALVLVGALTACGLVSSRVIPENVRSLNVTGTGRVTIVPDIATINIGVRTEDETVTAALEGNTAQAKAISSVLQEIGIEEKDIQTSNFNIYPTDRYNPMSGMVEGRYFVVENTVNVTVRNLSLLGEVLSAVVEAGANSIYGVNFNVADREAAVAEAQKLAVANANAKAAQIAEAAGVKLGELLHIQFMEGGYPSPYNAYGYGFHGEGDVPISAGSLTITTECQLTYAID